MELELYKEVIITQDIPEYNLRSGDVATPIDSSPYLTALNSVDNAFQEVA